jgi:hypothetical protein
MGSTGTAGTTMVGPKQETIRMLDGPRTKIYTDDEIAEVMVRAREIHAWLESVQLHDGPVAANLNTPASQWMDHASGTYQPRRILGIVRCHPQDHAREPKP